MPKNSWCHFAAGRFVRAQSREAALPPPLSGTGPGAESDSGSFAAASLICGGISLNKLNK